MRLLTVVAAITAATPAFPTTPEAQLNLPNGCVVESARFHGANLACARPSGIIMLQVHGGDHSFVAYEWNGSIWSHCTMLGDVDLKLAPGTLSKPKKIEGAYRRRFDDKLSRVTRRGEAWAVPDNRPNDTVAAQMLRAANALEAVRIKNLVLVLTDRQGRKHFALVMVWARSIAVYSPGVGTIFTGETDFTTDSALRFAKQHLRFTPVAASYVTADQLVAMTATDIARTETTSVTEQGG